MLLYPDIFVILLLRVKPENQIHNQMVKTTIYVKDVYHLEKEITM